MNGVPDRLTVIAALVCLTGAALCATGGWRLLQALRARFTYGAPYARGTIQVRLTGLLFDIFVLAIGAALGFVALGQAAFQPNGQTVRVGRVEAHRSGWGRVAVRLAPDPQYPGDRLLDGEVSGARWAIVGDFLTWPRGVLWLGFKNGHRVRFLVGSGDTTGTAPDLRSERQPLDSLPGPAFRLLAMAPYIPFLTVRSESSPWYPIEPRQIMILYATGSGYLGDAVSEGDPAGTPARPAPRPARR